MARQALACRKPLAAVILTLVLGACATPPATTPQAEGEPAAPLSERAASALDDGELDRAAALYEQAAAAGDEEQRARWLLRAALIRLDQRRPEEARRLLEAAPPPQDAQTRALARLVRGALRITESPGMARSRLEPVPSDLSPRVAASWERQLGRARLADGDALAAARAYSDGLEQARPQSGAMTEMRSALLAIDLKRLRQMIPAAPDAFGAWLELAYAVRNQRLQPEAITQGVSDWTQRYPRHVAASGFAQRWMDEAVATLQPPRAVGLLLPLSGPLAEIGEAIQRGFLTAYYDLPLNARPDLYVYDVGAEGADSLSAYRQAMAADVGLVVGPLTKRNLERLGVWDVYPVPVLALNRLSEPSEAGRGFYQFGLAPEDDAAAAARLALELGYRRVAELVPYNDWGNRVGESFRKAITAGGGDTVGLRAYDPQAEDYREPIRGLFQLDRGAQQRRSDMDAVFIAGYPQQARLLKPQIRFHDGIGLPVIATSHAYSGSPDQQADQDMNGLHLVVTPWVLGTGLDPELAALKRSAAAQWPGTLSRYPRLMALGLDAARLMGPVDVLAAEPLLAMPGATGMLSADNGGVIRRGLRAARIQDGQLRADESVPGVLGPSRGR